MGIVKREGERRIFLGVQMRDDEGGVAVLFPLSSFRFFAWRKGSLSTGVSEEREERDGPGEGISTL